MATGSVQMNRPSSQRGGGRDLFLVRRALAYLHGHAACLDGGCAMFGLNQAECCDGETAAASAQPTPLPDAATLHGSLHLPTDRPT